MKEITGNLWDYYNKEGYIICITTNGTVKKNGEAVMGRGCAKEATQRIPGIALRLGKALDTLGNVPYAFYCDGPEGTGVLSFPVKHRWDQNADTGLIVKSANLLADLALLWTDINFILPRPGCGNGGLLWQNVKPLVEPIFPDNVWVITNDASISPTR